MAENLSHATTHQSQPRFCLNCVSKIGVICTWIKVDNSVVQLTFVIFRCFIHDSWLNCVLWMRKIVHPEKHSDATLKLHFSDHLGSGCRYNGLHSCRFSPTIYLACSFSSSQIRLDFIPCSYEHPLPWEMGIWTFSISITNWNIEIAHVHTLVWSWIVWVDINYYVCHWLVCDNKVC